jgi:hypothetical protein
VIAKRLSLRAARHSRPFNLVRLLLPFVVALPILSPTSAGAGACDNQQVSISPRGDLFGNAALYNEESGNPMGKRHAGSVCWRLDLVKAAGQADKLVVHADVEIPDIGMRMEMDFSHNAGTSASASHYVSMKFEHPADIAGDEVVYVPGIMLKSSEQGKGAPFAALGTTVGRGSFLVALSGTEVDRRRNVQLLKERSWFDIPLGYANQRRGILAVEKGYRGEQIFREAMAEWERAR